MDASITGRGRVGAGGEVGGGDTVDNGALEAGVTIRPDATKGRGVDLGLNFQPGGNNELTFRSGYSWTQRVARFFEVTARGFGFIGGELGPDKPGGVEYAYGPPPEGTEGAYEPSESEENPGRPVPEGTDPSLANPPPPTEVVITETRLPGGTNYDLAVGIGGGLGLYVPLGSTERHALGVEVTAAYDVVGSRTTINGLGGYRWHFGEVPTAVRREEEAFAFTPVAPTVAESSAAEATVTISFTGPAPAGAVNVTLDHGLSVVAGSVQVAGDKIKFKVARGASDVTGVKAKVGGVESTAFVIPAKPVPLVDGVAVPNAPVQVGSETPSGVTLTHKWRGTGPAVTIAEVSFPVSDLDGKTLQRAAVVDDKNAPVTGRTVPSATVTVASGTLTATFDAPEAGKELKPDDRISLLLTGGKYIFFTIPPAPTVAPIAAAPTFKSAVATRGADGKLKLEITVDGDPTDWTVAGGDVKIASGPNFVTFATKKKPGPEGAVAVDGAGKKITVSFKVKGGAEGDIVAGDVIRVVLKKSGQSDVTLRIPVPAISSPPPPVTAQTFKPTLEAAPAGYDHKVRYRGVFAVANGTVEIRYGGRTADKRIDLAGPYNSGDRSVAIQRDGNDLVVFVKGSERDRGRVLNDLYAYSNPGASEVKHTILTGGGKAKAANGTAPAKPTAPAPAAPATPAAPAAPAASTSDAG